jgi:hypothetical protein
MNRLRNRLIAAFLAATIVQLAATLWITTSLLDRSLRSTATEELDKLSKTFEQTAREFYQQARVILKADADAGRISPLTYETAKRANWPVAVQEFSESGESERFGLSGESELRGDSNRASGKRIVWTRKRRVHRRGFTAAR